MVHSKDGSIEIDVSLNMDNIGRDFDELEKKAKEGTRSVVKAVDQIAEAMEETGTEAKKAGQEYEKAAEEMEESAKDAAKGAENLQEAVEDTVDSADDMQEAVDDAAKSTEDLEKSMDDAAESTEDLEKSEEKLGDQSRKTGEEQEDLGDKTEETRKEVEKSRGSFLNWGEVAQTAVKGVVVVAGALLTALGAVAGVAVDFGTEYQQASNTIQASTGATKEEMEGLRDVMAGVYANNFGEDMNDVADAVANVKKNIGGTDQEIQKVTEAAFAFRDTFGYEVPESTRAAKAMMDNFGISAEEAYDLMAKGAQNGLDYSGELIDNINEYSVQFGKAGLSAEDMFNIMAAGADAGAWNLDKIGDAVKELNIRLVDGSTTTEEGLKAIGMNADEVAEKMSKGGETARKTYQKVVKGLAEMDDKQEQNIAGVNLFGTMWEDLGPEVIAHLADVDGAYNDVKGTMDEINEVKYDDAKSALEALKRKAEVSLLLPISNDIMPAISNATKAATGYIDELASAYDSQGVNGLVEKAGEIFADIATNAAEQAPKMVEVAVSFIDQTVEGFQDNSDKLVKAGGDLVKAIAGAAVKMLPSELQEPVKDAVDDLVDSLTGGGIKNGLKTFGTIFENGFKVVSKVTKTILPPFVKIVDKTADNMDTLIPLVVAGAAAFKGYSVVNGVTSWLKGLTAVTATLTAMEKANALQIAASTGALTAKEMTVGILTRKVTLATAATAAWNVVLNANPIALLTAGVVAAGAAIAAYCLLSDDGAQKTGELSEAEQELKNRVNEQTEAYQKLREEREQQFEKINKEFSNTQALANELQTIVDKNGKIKKGYEDRAAVIVGLLNEALGTEIEITDGVIQKYDELKQSVDQVIASKKAEAIQSAMQESYSEAINNQTQAYMDYAQAQKDVEQTTKDLEEAQERLKEVQERSNQIFSEADFTAYQEEHLKALESVEALKKKQEDQQQTLQKSEEAYIGYVTTIENYEGIVGGIASEDANQLDEALLRATNSFITAENGTKESLERQVSNMTSNYDSLKAAVASGAPGVTQQMVDEAAIMVMEATVEYAKLAPNASAEIEKLDPAIIETFAKAGLEGKLSNEGKKALKGFTESLDSLDSDTREKFEMAVEGALKGLDGFDEIQTKAEEEGLSFLKVLADSLEIQSPSKAVKEIFSYVNPGAVEGLNEGKGALLDEGKNLISEFLETLSAEELEAAGKSAGDKAISSMSNAVTESKSLLVKAGKEVSAAAKTGLESVKTTDTGTKFGTMFETGVNSTKSKNNAAAKGIATLARTAMAAVSTIATGNTFGGQFASGISAKSSASRTSGSLVAIAARTAMAAVNATSTGAGMGAQYASGIQSKNSSAKSAGVQLGNSARSGASVDGTDLGRNFGQGFVNGITGKVMAAAQAAANLAANALSAAQKKIDSHSPSKETDKLGRYFGQGFVNGIVRLTAQAAEAAGDMGLKAVEAFQQNLGPDGLEFDVEAIMRRVDDAVQSRIASYAASQNTAVQENANSDDFKKKADYLISGFKKVVKEQGDTVIYWKEREIGRMVREVLE